MNIYRKSTLILTALAIGILHAKIAESASPANNPIQEITATPEILITEVHFKNANNDKVIITSFNDSPVNLKNWSFKDDSIIHTIPSDYLLEQNKTIELIFNQTSQSALPIINAQKKGLTATTEQIILLDPQKQVIDAVCWTSDKPTTAEIKDHKELFNLLGWNSPDINSCISSTKISKNEYIKRINQNDTDSKMDWAIISLKPLTSENTSSKTLNTTKSTNGTLSKDIYISEIFPNPEGTDKGKEWLELCNRDNNKVNLSNWYLELKENGKPFIIENKQIEPRQCVLMEKISIKNTNNTIKLFDFNKSLIDQITYPDAPSGKSLSIYTDSQNNTETAIWSNQTTPGATNPRLTEITGEITSQEINTKTLTITTVNGPITFTYDPKIFPDQIIKGTFTPGKQIKCLLTENKNQLLLLKFEILDTPAPQLKTTNNIIPITISLFLATIILLYTGKIVFKSKSKCQTKKAPHQKENQSVKKENPQIQQKNQSTKKEYLQIQKENRSARKENPQAPYFQY